MEASVILETSFLIDMEREISQGKAGPAQNFLEKNAASRLYITPTIAGEMAAGNSLDDREVWAEFIAPFHILSINKNVSWEYGRAYRYLKENGILIGSNDLWIAAAALAYSLPVVTRNPRHYRRVPGVRVAEYG